MHMMLGLVSAGVGVAIVPSTLARIKLERARCVRLSETLPAQEIRLAWLADAAPPTVLRLAEVAKSLSWGETEERSP
jgi:DNA-binding transcriptional LysR family regulator